LNVAVQAVRNKEMGYLKASKQFGIPKRLVFLNIRIAREYFHKINGVKNGKDVRLTLNGDMYNAKK